MTRAEPKELILKQWRLLPASERTEVRVSSFAVQAAKDYPFESANTYGLVRLWLLEELNNPKLP
jgi:hypothetical protein